MPVAMYRTAAIVRPSPLRGLVAWRPWKPRSSSKRRASKNVLPKGLLNHFMRNGLEARKTFLPLMLLPLSDHGYLFPICDLKYSPFRERFPNETLDCNPYIAVRFGNTCLPAE